MKPYLASLPRHAHTSHRGGSLLAPENTLPAFTQAVEKYGTHVLELDVQPTSDGHVMVFHDDTLERTTNGSGAVRAHTLAQLQALDAGFHHAAWRGKGVTIPTLAQVFTQFPRHHINIELKQGDDAFVEAFARVVEAHDAVDRVCIGHVEEERSRAIAARLPRCCLWYPQEGIMAFFAGVKGFSPPPPVDVPWDVLSVPVEHLGMRVVDRDFVEAAHRAGKVVHVWTVDDAPMMEELWDLGVDSILTDRPDTLREVMTRRGW